ncbi:synapse-associated protein 1-like [Pristis pectinata]|uniref:synapse-associated protein 1-like n=1 Tax=Pristis pectinata TaxID=685728 RepID=UPI00223CE2DF|nr:synapse-associated protein 1-like [Pristis pectinata]
MRSGISRCLPLSAGCFRLALRHRAGAMFRTVGSWFGLEELPPGGQGGPAEGTAGGDAAPDATSQVKGLGDYLFSFATAATKKISESVVETAQTIKKSVEEGNIDGVIDKTIIGDFQKEQDKFVQEKLVKKTDAAVPPWVGYSEEETIQQQILALSAERRNFLRDPPAGVQFNFDFDQMYPVAAVMLQEDELLNRMRFDLVPKLVKEEVFWRNYFYRVSLIKQSAQLTALAAQQQTVDQEEKEDSKADDSHLTETIRSKTPPFPIKTQTESQEEEEEISTSPGATEFISDTYDGCDLNQEDLRKEIEQFVLDKKDGDSKEASADWEEELQQELQDYEVVAETEKTDENWDKEIEELLKADG